MKVTLLGDSIRQIGYGTRVPALLGDAFEVWQPAENCRFAQYTLRGMWDWAGGMAGSDIVHWNNGLWDVCDIFGDGYFTPKDIYVDTMVRTAKILLSRHKKVIFATTTPVTDENPYNKNADIIAFNEAVVPRLAELGVIINDLHATVYADIDAYIRKDDNIHLTDAGIEICAAQVAEAIRAAAREI
ncbi:MAG: SGNH/GDSL hydrolase family protein [Clostridia bacterium]|nr:SGNH/GDSL hydrolase family protein [Clostridia bacterium]